MHPPTVITVPVASRVPRGLMRLWTFLPHAFDAYGTLISLYLIARQLLGERFEAIALANMVLHYIVGGCIVLAPLRLLWKRRLLLLLNAVPALLLIAYYTPNFLPKAIPAPTVHSLTILSYNVRGGMVDRIISVVNDANADVVFLQDAAMSYSLEAGTVLAGEYPYQEFTLRDSRGLFIMSRYAFTEQAHVNPRLGFVRSSIEVGGQSLALYNIHLQSPIAQRAFDSSRRAEQLAQILILTAQDSTPHLLMGDFNLPEWSPLYADITQRYTDAQRAQGWGLGLTRDIGEIPISRIDYAFASPAFSILESRTWAYSAGSDHRPIFVRLGIN